MSQTQVALALVKAPGVLSPPGGRLTLTQGQPVMTTDSTFTSSIYYFPYITNTIPIYNGSQFINQTFSSLALVATTSQQLASTVYDVYAATLSSQTLAIGFSPAWTSVIARGSGAGTTQIAQINGIWTNAQTVTLTNAATIYSGIPVGQATLLGTVAFSSSAALTAMQYNPTAVAGGNNNFLGVFNSYNRVPIIARSLDSTSTWTYATSTWRQANNSSGNAITFVDGLQVSSVDVEYFVNATTGNNIDAGVGVALDWSSGAPVFSAIGGEGTVTGTAQFWLSAPQNFPPQLGLHSVKALEVSAGGTTTFQGSGFVSTQNQMLRLGMHM